MLSPKMNSLLKRNLNVIQSRIYLLTQLTHTHKEAHWLHTYIEHTVPEQAEFCTLRPAGKGRGKKIRWKGR